LCNEVRDDRLYRGAARRSARPRRPRGGGLSGHDGHEFFREGGTRQNARRITIDPGHQARARGASNLRLGGGRTLSSHPAVHRGEYWRIIAAMFLHGGWLHWFLNCWSLYQLGTLYETLFGSARFALIYFVSSICASIASSLYQHGPAVGASGAIFGILGAFIFSIRRSPQYRHQPWTRSLVGQLIFWIAVNIVIGFSVKFIDNAAHIAGLVTGLLLGFLP